MHEFAHHGATNRHLPLLERADHVISFCETGTQASRQRRVFCNDGAINPGDGDPVIEKRKIGFPVFQHGLQPRWILHHGCRDFCRKNLQRPDPVAHFVVDAFRHERCGRLLLIAQQVLHIVAQTVLCVVGDGPQAGQKDDQRENGHPCLERAQRGSIQVQTNPFSRNPLE